MHNIISKKYAGLLVLLLFMLVSLAACAGSSVSVVGQPTVSAAKVDSVLCNAGSPACGTGGSLYSLSAQYNIDDAVALAFFKHESGYGLQGIAQTTRSLGNIRCENGYACVNGFAAFSSWVQGYQAWFVLIGGPLYVQGGLTTVDAILSKYDPSPAESGPYISDVEQSVSSYRQQ